MSALDRRIEKLEQQSISGDAGIRLVFEPAGDDPAQWDKYRQDTADADAKGERVLVIRFVGSPTPATQNTVIG